MSSKFNLIVVTVVL